MSESVLKSNNKQDSKIDAKEYYNTSANCDVSDGDEKIVMKVESDDGDVKVVSQRENRLTNIIEQLRNQSEMKGSGQRELPVAPSNGE
ncbi:uncharacterized protein LOC134669841 [Cydia fagiglandana]|uniref:uncharacterized protein LOC134669841 n=1 Tax=Cydia fagiglandana TaxID=1458189 RepID=UPI002FEE09A1